MQPRVSQEMAVFGCLAKAILLRYITVSKYIYFLMN